MLIPDKLQETVPISLTLGAAIPSIPRQIHPLHHIPLDRHRRPSISLPRSHSHRSGLVHRYTVPRPTLRPVFTSRPGELTYHSVLLPWHLPPQPLPRLPSAQIRALPDAGRRHRRRVATHESRRGVPPFHQEITGVQVLVFGDEGDRDRVCVYVV